MVLPDTQVFWLSSIPWFICTCSLNTPSDTPLLYTAVILSLELQHNPLESEGLLTHTELHRELWPTVSESGTHWKSAFPTCSQGITMLLVPAPYSGPTSVQHPLSHNFRNFILHFFSEFLLVYNGSVVMNLPGDAGATGDMGLIPGLGRSPRGGNGNPLQDSCLDNPMDRRAWRATIQRVTKSPG